MQTTIAADAVHPVHPVRRQREAAGLSLRQTGVLTGIPFRKLWLIEHGLRASTIELRLIAAALRVGVEDLQD